MKWPVKPPVSDAETPVWLLYYLGACTTPNDSTILWGTDIDVTDAETFLQTESRKQGVFLSMSHLQLHAVARTMARHPEFNRRVIGRRIYEYKTIDLMVPIYLAAEKEIEVLILHEADTLTLPQIGRWLWEHNCAAARGQFAYRKRKTFFERLPRWFIRSFLWMHFKTFNNVNVPLLPCYRRENIGGAMVNYFGSPGTPNMRMFKPSRFPSEATPLCLMMGPTEDRVVVREGAMVVRRIAPLFFRADHRIVQGGYAMREFLNTLVGYLEAPQTIPLAGESAPSQPLKAA